jgi:hypothetical protein
MGGLGAAAIGVSATASWDTEKILSPTAGAGATDAVIDADAVGIDADAVGIDADAVGIDADAVGIDADAVGAHDPASSAQYLHSFISAAFQAIPRAVNSVCRRSHGPPLAEHGSYEPTRSDAVQLSHSDILAEFHGI